MKVDSLFCFILLCWNFPNQITWYNIIDIFENYIGIWGHYWYFWKALTKFDRIEMIL
jgi:hypothetical protein